MKVTQHQKVNIVLLILCFFFLSSCDNDDVYSHFKVIEKQEWGSDEVFVFEVDSSLIEPGTLYSVKWELIHSSNYPYRNIWFYIQNNINEMSAPQKEVTEYTIGDEFGKWSGAGFGSLYQLSLVYRKELQFKEKRNYKFEIRHGMRDDPLIGIDKIGLRIEKLK